MTIYVVSILYKYLSRNLQGNIHLPSNKKIAMRDADFTDAVLKEITQKAMFICSSPECTRLTGYATTEGKARTIAQGAHINAAGKNGPRANKGASIDFLKSAENGIWLCSICHKLVDDDPTYYTESILKEWKEKHEKMMRTLVGKDLESMLLDLRNRRQYHNEMREFLSFMENKRVMYEGMDHEFPPRVLESLKLIRERLIQTRAKVNPDTDLFVVLNKLQDTIDTFLRNIGKSTDLNTLRCDSNDPKWRKFADELLFLRKGIVIIMKILAGDAGYTLSWV
jgi:hypothetical protein